MAEDQDRPAQIQSLAHVAWPQGAGRRTVTLRVFVHEDGHALRATAEPGTPADAKVIQAATEAALRSRFLPARRGGQAVRGWVEVEVKP